MLVKSAAYDKGKCYANMMPGEVAAIILAGAFGVGVAALATVVGVRWHSGCSVPSTRILVASLTTIPSRFAHIDETVQSLLNQGRPADKIILNIPQHYNVRFKDAISDADIEAFQKRYPTVTVHRTSADFGPGTKLLGALQALQTMPEDKKQNTYVAIFDDDQRYAPYVMERVDKLYDMSNTKCEAFSGDVYTVDGLRITQGSDVTVFPLQALHAIWPYFAHIQNDPACMHHDDVWISGYLALMRIPLHHTSFGRTDGKMTDVNALKHLKGSLSRENVTKKAVQAVKQLNKEWQDTHTYLHGCAT